MFPSSKTSYIEENTLKAKKTDISAPNHTQKCPGAPEGVLGAPSNCTKALGVCQGALGA